MKNLRVALRTVSTDSSFCAKRYSSFFSALARLHQSDVFRFHLDGCGQEHGYLHEQALASGAADGDQGACISVQRASDDGHLSLAHVGGNLLRGVVAGGMGALDGEDETFHVAVGDGHRFTPRVTQVTVLEGTYAFHKGVELFARAVGEDQVLNVGHLPGLPLSAAGHHLPDQRGEMANVLGTQHFPGGQFGVVAAQVAHHEPSAAIGGKGFRRGFAGVHIFGQGCFYQSCKW